MEKKDSKAQPKANRHQRRSRQAVSRKAAPGRTADFVTAGIFNETLKKIVGDFNTAIQQLSSNQERLGKVLNNNQHALVSAFSMTDGHLYVLRVIANNLLCGTARPKPLHPDDAAWLEEAPHDENEISERHWLHVTGQVVDYEWYYEQYNAHVKANEAAEVARVEAEAAKVAAEGQEGPSKPEETETAEATAATDPGETVFGGDYASTDAPPS